MSHGWVACPDDDVRNFHCVRPLSTLFNRDIKTSRQMIQVNQDKGTIDVTSCFQVMDKMVEDKVGGQVLTAPSVSFGSINLYMRGPLEEDTRPNLSKVCFPNTIHLSPALQTPTPTLASIAGFFVMRLSALTHDRLNILIPLSLPRMSAPFKS